MENSKLPFVYWITAIYLMLQTKKGVSSLEIKRRLNCKRYEPVLMLCHKIRATKGSRDQLHNLPGEIEMDECFVTVMENAQNRLLHKSKAEGEPLTRGSGSERKQVVAVMTSFDSVQKKVGGCRGRSRKVKMSVIDESTAKAIGHAVEDNIDPKATLYTDGLSSCKHIRKHVTKHIAMACPPKMASKTLRVVHLVIENLKRKLLGINHCQSRGFVQLYL